MLSRDLILTRFLVESHKASLTTVSKLKCSVDWLTEVMRRLTEAWVAQREFTTVNMKSSMRHEKASAFPH